jgi:copper(I)-binding protein
MTLWMGMVSAADTLMITNAWIREAPPGAPMLAGYLCLNNTADTPVTLVGVESPVFEYIMMHRTETVDGMARMLHQDQVVVAAGTRVCFEPGGLHLMMPAPEQRLVAGDQLELNLQFADGSSRRIQASVKAP